MEKINVLLVEDDPNWRLGLTKLLENESDISVISSCSTKEEAIRYATTIPIEIILMDIMLDDDRHAGIDAVLDICYSNPEAKIIMLTSMDDPDTISEAIFSGALNYVVKRDFQDIPKTIRAVHANQAGLHYSVSDTLREQFVKLKREQLKEKLNREERDMLRDLNDGLAYKEIAEKKTMELQSVRSKFYKISKKLMLGLKSNKQVAEKAKKLGLLD